MEKQHPIHESERLPWIDAARGFALFGILMVNVPAFHAPFFLYGGEEIYWPGSIDRAVGTVIDIFFQASFYTLFSLLFGFGMQMMKERLETRGHPWRKILFRRLIVLILFGILHSFLLWHGDILLSYGIIGLFLFFFYSRNVKTLLTWFYFLLLIPAVLMTVLSFNYKEELEYYINHERIQMAMENYRSDLTAVLHQNYLDWIYANGGLNYLFLALLLLPMFLIGAVFMRNKWLHDPVKYDRWLKKLWLLSLIGFVLFKGGPYLFEERAWLNFLQDDLGGMASSIFYLLTITLLYQKGIFKKWLKIFEYTGRLSLTNYIMQSIICFTLFYGPGFGLYGSVSPLESAGIVFMIYSFQVMFSRWWLSRFYYGPLEWIWRALTYHQLQAMKRKRVMSYE